MMFDDKKKAANVILSRLKKDGSESHTEMKPEAQVDHAFHGLHAAAEDMINAIHNRSAHDMHRALKSFLEQHSSMPEDKPDGSNPSENGKAEEKFESGHYKP